VPEYRGRLSCRQIPTEDPLALWVLTDDGEPVALGDLLASMIGQRVTVRLERGSGRWWLLVEGGDGE